MLTFSRLICSSSPSSCLSSSSSDFMLSAPSFNAYCSKCSVKARIACSPNGRSKARSENAEEDQSIQSWGSKGGGSGGGEDPGVIKEGWRSDAEWSDSGSVGSIRRARKVCSVVRSAWVTCSSEDDDEAEGEPELPDGPRVWALSTSDLSNAKANGNGQWCSHESSNTDKKWTCCIQETESSRHWSLSTLSR